VSPNIQQIWIPVAVLRGGQVWVATRPTTVTVKTYRGSRQIRSGMRYRPFSAPRHILSKSCGNSIPAALAACGNRLVAVIPGKEFASKHQ
jgi:hypothetical protein